MTSNKVKKIKSALDDMRVEIAKELGSVLSERESRVTKPDGSYVTRGDLRMQELVVSSLRNALPGLVVISEEMENKPFGDESPDGIIAVIDPIDGTENFTSGLPEWGVSVAVFAEGRHAASLLGCPQMDIWLSSDQTLRRFQSRIHGLSSSLSKDELLSATSGYEYRILGCCVYNMINVIRGSFCSFENPKGANSWDILAGLNIALEHGLKVTVEGNNYAGEYLPADQKYRFKISE